MKNFSFIPAITLWLAMIGIGFMGAAQATPQFQKATAAPNGLSVAQVAKPAQCAAGFTPVNVKLVEFEGNKWYQYDCVQQKIIKRSCNADTDVTKVKNQFVSLPSDGQSDDSKLYLSYSCFNYVPVK